MKRMTVFFTAIYLAFMTHVGVQAQAQQSPATSIGVFVAPTKGQTPEIQTKDEGECYASAKQTTGTDPAVLAEQSKQAQQQAQQAQEQAAGASKQGAGKGAAAGAATGGIVRGIRRGEPLKGAAIGAATGAIVGGAVGKSKGNEAQQEIDKQAQAGQQAMQEQMDNFKKSFGVCMEVRDYAVK